MPIEAQPPMTGDNLKLGCRGLTMAQVACGMQVQTAILKAMPLFLALIAGPMTK